MTRPLLLDAMLGKLARYLRMCGYDAAYVLDRGIEEDAAVLALAGAEGRRIVTRDASLAARADDAVLLESREIEDQLRELRAAGFDLALTEPERCGRCNGRLEQLPDDAPRPSEAPDPGGLSVWRCPDCGQHFWRGSHWEDVRERLARIEEE